MLQEHAISFWSFDMGHLLELGAFVVAYLAYRGDRRKDADGRQVARDAQVAMHTENKNRIETLAEFHQFQQKVNLKRDEQISQLATQTAILQQMALGQERRLQMLENRSQ